MGHLKYIRVVIVDSVCRHAYCYNYCRSNLPICPILLIIEEDAPWP
jgi:hypothetical protein